MGAVSSRRFANNGNFPVLVTGFDPVAITAVHHGPPPWFIVKIPMQCVRKSLGKLMGRDISQLDPDLCLVDRIATVVAQAIGDVGLDTRGRDAASSRSIRKARRQPGINGEGLVDGCAKRIDHAQVRQFGTTADIVAFTDFSIAQNQLDAPAVVINIKPIADLLAIAIDGQGAAMQSIHQEQWNELFGKLVGSIIVRTV